ncbi:site-specific DNA-methyltransferase [Campylobacter peloridis]|uniref:site-specific DNA-methyltransferase (adenine-specific) n=2 Tax=Campylobacter peloridis TaxID=488546 RepID=A0A5C7DYT2_9BACT|nr:site-specific DNA-methyltransferase [Campylobacter peloridis]
MHTANKADENFRKLAQLFPNAITETIDENGEVIRAIDKDILMQEINTKVVDGKEERYQFTWPDKKKSILLANQPINKTLRPCVEESVGKDGTKGGFDSENLYIEGDNLEVLKLLQETYLGKIKMIYIDPPYNTGNDFVYNDDFKINAQEWDEQSGDYDDEGNRLVKNLDSNGRFHTDWLNMMYPRLKLAKDLLTDDGAIFISIDENEVNTLKNVCDEVFGRSNFIAEMIWAAGRKNDSKYISVSHEYILCYFRNFDYIKENKVIWREKKQGLDDIYAKYEQLKRTYANDYEMMTKELKRWFANLPDSHPAKDHSHYNKVDENGVYFSDNISWPGGGGPKYNILHPITGKPVKIPSRGWLTNEKTMKEWIAQGRVAFGKDEKGVPTLKSYLRDREFSVPYSVFYKDGRAASKRLATLLGDKVFENPKDEKIIKRIIEFCGVSDGDYVLDFFSGSGTTAHAAFLANVEQNMRCSFILVQLPEEISEKTATSEKSKKVARSAMALCDSLGLPYTICEIGKERIRRAGAKIKEENPLTTQNLDIGFRVLKCDSSNMKDVYYNPAEYTQQGLADLTDNIKEDRTPKDLLFQVMLDLGVLLSSKIEEQVIDNKKVFNVADGFLMACFDEDITEEVITKIAKEKPYYFIMRDSSMQNDSITTNFEQIFATYSPDTLRKVL